MTAQDITFAFQVAPTGTGPDHQQYAEVVEDAKLGQSLGYESAWLLEHHFSDYFPTPSPLLHMAHIAAHCPGLGLGTSVLVTPWYHPLRLAEEISMLNSMTTGTLHLGLGRGTAKSEYDAYGVDMNEARGRFAEIWHIVQTALTGEPFHFKGAYYDIARDIRLRPSPTDKAINFYGAIGSLPSAGIMADLGLTPLCLSTFPDRLLRRILETWREGMKAKGRTTNVHYPVSVKLFLGDTDEEARQLARRYLPHYFELQASHYEVDATPWDGIPEYEAFSKMFANLKQLTNPDNLGPFIESNFIGSVETVRARIQALIDVGFDYFMISAAMPGVPQAVRQDQYRRFATQLAPEFSRNFGRARAGQQAAAG